MSETLATVSDLEAEPQEQAVLAERIGAHATLGALTESADEATLITSAEPTGATASEDWTSISSLADSLNTDHGSVYRRVSKLEESYPQWVKTESHAKGLVKVLHPELAALVTQEIEKHKGLPIAPEGVMTIYGIAQLTGVDFITVRRVMARLEEPPQTKLFRSPGNGRAREYYLPEDIDKIKALLEAHVPAPDGAETVLTIARRLNVSFTRTKAVVDSMKEKHPELFGHHKNTRNKAVQYCYPEAVRLLEERLGGYDPVPVDEGWVSWPSLQKQSGHTITTLQKIAAPIFESHPELLKKFKNSVGRTAEYCHPEAVKLIYEEFSKYEPAPAEWYTNQGLASELGVSFKVVQRVINGFQDEYAEEVKNFRGPKGQVFTHYGPTFVSAIKARIEFERDQNEITLDKLRETEELDKGLRGFSQEVNDNESAIAQEFRSLVSLFGSERVRDILYRYHPEYQNLPVPYVKSVIADYLGDFLSAPPKLDLESLEVGVQFLFDTTLKEGLTEVVKLDCLSFYNSLKKIGDLGDADLEAILEHISDLRAETAHYSTEELSDVFNEVEDYYR